MDQIRVDIAPALRGLLDVSKVIGPAGTLISVLKNSSLDAPGFFFRVLAPGYHLEFGVSAADIYLVRNDQKLLVLMGKIARPRLHTIITAVWSPDRIRLNVFNSATDVTDEIASGLVAPPNSLLEWARRNALVPKHVYHSERDVLQAVMSQLDHINKTIRDTSVDAFWDTMREGQLVVSKTPKRETEAQSILSMLLHDIDIKCGIQVSPEHPTGSGRIDFLLSTQLANGAITNVCVECKNAHSRDLVHGLEVQLPEYMKSKATDLGIYLVLDFGPEFPMTAPVFDFPIALTGLEADPKPEFFHWGGGPIIRKFRLQLFKRAPPSKR